MLKIKYKGYIISQASNNHVAICKNNQMLFHAQCNKKMNKEELKKQLEFYLGLYGLLDKILKGDSNEI